MKSRSTSNHAGRRQRQAGARSACLAFASSPIATLNASPVEAVGIVGRHVATIPPSLAGQPLTLRFISTTQSSGDNSPHHDFALDAIQLSRLDADLRPLAWELQSVQRQPDGSTSVTLNWLSAAGVTNRVESSTDLATPWTIVQTGIEATPPVNTITVQFPSSDSRGFLRVVGM